MAGADPSAAISTTESGGSELLRRVLSSIVLVPLAIGAAWLGGWPFALFWGLAAIGVFWEWCQLVSPPDARTSFGMGTAALIFALALSAIGYYGSAVIVLGMGMLAVAALSSREQRGWMVAGIGYAGAIFLAPIMLRADGERGFTVVIMVLVIIWATDIAAYFVGRALGGPKLWPRVSPKKTWSGAIGGIVAAVAAALAVAVAAGVTGLVAAAILAFVLSVASQGGDLAESAIKRRFGAKDTGTIIPGHGGIMDRLDGFVAAAALAVLIGLAQGEFAAPARALLVW